MRGGKVAAFRADPDFLAEFGRAVEECRSAGVSIEKGEPYRAAIWAFIAMPISDRLDALMRARAYDIERVKSRLKKKDK